MTPSRSDPTAGRLACCAKAIEIAHVAENAGGARGDLVAFRRELHARARALDQHQAEALLQLVDLHRQRRLRHGAGIGRAAEVQLARQRIEIAKLLERHVRASDNLIMRANKYTISSYATVPVYTWYPRASAERLPACVAVRLRQQEPAGNGGTRLGLTCR